MIVNTIFPTFPCFNCVLLFFFVCDNQNNLSKISLFECLISISLCGLRFLEGWGSCNFTTFQWKNNLFFWTVLFLAMTKNIASKSLALPQNGQELCCEFENDSICSPKEFLVTWKDVRVTKQSIIQHPQILFFILSFDDFLLICVKILWKIDGYCQYVGWLKLKNKAKAVYMFFHFFLLLINIDVLG